MDDGYGFNPRNVNHRILFRQSLDLVGRPNTTQAITSLLDYIDELEEQLKPYLEYDRFCAEQTG